MDQIYTDQCLAFQIDQQDIKGRIIRLDHVLNDILNRHNENDTVKAVLGEAKALAAMLGSMMKFEGILTIQLKSDGIISSLVSDYATDGKGSGVVRGYSSVNADAPITAPLLGDGQLVITMDQGQYMERYQGIVKLKNNSLQDSVEDYFLSSEQLPSSLKVACAKNDDGKWCSAALLIQHLAKNTEDQREEDKTLSTDEDNWNTAKILLGSLKQEEMLALDLSLQDILLRLYHESGIRVFGSTEMTNGCRCSEKKLRSVLANFQPQELQDVAEDGVITMTCEFCKTDHKFELKKLIN